MLCVSHIFLSLYTAIWGSSSFFFPYENISVFQYTASPSICAVSYQSLSILLISISTQFHIHLSVYRVSFPLYSISHPPVTAPGLLPSPLNFTSASQCTASPSICTVFCVLICQGFHSNVNASLLETVFFFFFQACLLFKFF